MSKILFPGLINVNKWEAAGWSAAAFFYDPKGVIRPCLGLVFENMRAAKEIFFDIREELGGVDEFEELDISIAEGEIHGVPSAYSVRITTHPGHTEARLRAQGRRPSFKRAVMAGTHINVRTTPDFAYLRAFQSQLRKHGRYGVMPVSTDLKPAMLYVIEKKEIHFQQASEYAA